MPYVSGSSCIWQRGSTFGEKDAVVAVLAVARHVIHGLRPAVLGIQPRRACFGMTPTRRTGLTGVAAGKGGNERRDWEM